MRPLLVPSALALFALSPAAQTAHPGNTVILEPPNSTACPVGLQAQKAPQGAVIQIDRTGEQHHAAGLSITLDALHSGQRLTQARVTVDGISGGHILPAAEGQQAGDVTEQFTLAHTGSPKAHLETTVYTKQITGIRWIQLDELTYADGTTWHAQPGVSCRISPSLYLRVDAAAQR